jgi:methionyl-tRNA formyltransferase
VSDTATGSSSPGRALDPAPVRTVFLGSGRFAVPILEALVSMPGIWLEAVVSAPDRPVGRKAVLTPTPATARARELGLTVLQPARVRRPEAVEALRAMAPDLMLLADYGQLIPRALLDLPPRGFLNVHPSALPRHRGAAPIAATILGGDTESAVTLMVLAEEMDAGPIVAVAPLEVRSDDTAVTLEERAARVGSEMVSRMLPEWLAGRLVAQPQAAEGVTVTRPLHRRDGLIDPLRPAVELERQVRAYQPWPGSYIQSERTASERLIVWQAHVGAGVPADVAGHLVTTADGGLALATGDGRLVLDVVQRAGGQRMSAAEYLRGHSVIAR